ncbi:Uncharacterized protein GBIM_11564 [Gryllus bimaculatus]|nr:Uncharacterized protein GBIM_11564 [Gryllus bimaculatus]
MHCVTDVLLNLIWPLWCVAELERLQNGGKAAPARAAHEEKRFADIIKEKPIKVTIRVLVPVKEHPKVYKLCLASSSICFKAWRLKWWPNKRISFGLPVAVEGTTSVLG